MSIITLSIQYGCDGSQVGSRLSSVLGYRLVDGDIPIQVARKADVQIRDVMRWDGLADHALLYGLKKTLLSNYPGVPASIVEEQGWLRQDCAFPIQKYEIFDEEMCAKLICELILEEARSQNAVFVGRGAHLLLNEHRHALHVDIGASERWRVRNVMMRKRLAFGEAQQRVRNTEYRRLRFLKRYFNGYSLPGDMLTLNAEQHDIVGLVQAIVDEATKRELVRDRQALVGV